MVVSFVGAEIGIEAVGDGVKATEIAKAALFLASDDSAYMTGSERPSVANQSMFIRNPITGSAVLLFLWLVAERFCIRADTDARYVAIAKRPDPECRF